MAWEMNSTTTFEASFFRRSQRSSVISPRGIAIGTGSAMRRRNDQGVRLLHRARAAFFAMAERREAVSLAALAFPPFTPPSRPNATAAGFLPSAGSGVRSTVLSTMNLASWLTSRGRLPGPVVMRMSLGHASVLGQARPDSN